MPQSERWGIQPLCEGQPKGHKITCGPGEGGGDGTLHKGVLSKVGDISFLGESDLEPVVKDRSLSRGAQSSQ